MIEGAIHNPSRRDHFMQLDALDQRVTIVWNGREIAVSDRAIRLLECGRRLYPPQYYIPVEDIGARLVRSDRTSHCPLKGNATYFDLHGEDGGAKADDLGWSYAEPYDFAAQLAGHIAFDPRRVTITVEAAN